MENGLIQAVTRLVFQLFVILAIARIFSEITERWFKQPGVLGELVGGIIIGPYALGSLVIIPHLGPLFGLPVQGGNPIPLSTELYALAQIAVVILLFYVGLETELDTFRRYAGPSLVIALGGLVFPFILGDLATVAFGYADSFLHPTALFMGAVLTATSVGITARVLSERGKLGTPEGVTILASAVVDDVLGIIVLAIVVSLARGGEFSLAKVGIISLKAVGFWVVLMAVGIASSKKLCRLLRSFKTPGASTTLALALCFLAAGVAELFGLAMIIGAYAMGLSLSRTEVAQDILDGLSGIYRVFVPIFFVVMGMLVDLRSLGDALVFGLVITFLAIVSKVGGCFASALTVGFNRLGGIRIGIGMLPRGEVALIIAGVGLSAGAIESFEFSTAIIMTFITTLMAPILLVPAFARGGAGTRKPVSGKGKG